MYAFCQIHWWCASPCLWCLCSYWQHLIRLSNNDIGGLEPGIAENLSICAIYMAFRGGLYVVIAPKWLVVYTCIFCFTVPMVTWESLRKTYWPVEDFLTQVRVHRRREQGGDIGYCIKCGTRLGVNLGFGWAWVGFLSWIDDFRLGQYRSILPPKTKVQNLTPWASGSVCGLQLWVNHKSKFYFLILSFILILLNKT